MALLIAARYALMKQGRLSEGLKGGVSFWSMMYIPIVVAMAAQQNVVAAVRGGPMVLIAGTLVVAVSFALVRVLGGRSASPEAGS
jgi:malonate transporter MadL subunit